ncbi:MAG: hypothetical protein K6T65_11990 [Peptococcaceae bacterium]|nr:hypothetical protein [Peptococcaceae bacterium]
MLLRIRRGKLICFTGIDGSGKTTLAKSFVYEMQKKVDCKYIYGRYQPVLLKPFMFAGRFFFLKGKSADKNYKEFKKEKSNAISRYIFLYSIYIFVLFIDYYIRLLFLVIIPLLYGKNVVCDRYIYDTIITDISTDLGLTKEKICKLIRFCYYLLPRPDYVFLIDLPEIIAYGRKNDVPSIDYLTSIRGTYFEVGKLMDMKILDGTLDRKTLLNKVISVLYEDVPYKQVCETSGGMDK